MNSNIAIELSAHEKLMRVHGYLHGIQDYDHGVMCGDLAGKTPSQIIEELLKSPSVSVETKTEDSGIPEAAADHVTAVLQNVDDQLAKLPSEHGGNSLAVGASPKTSAPASSKFKMSIFENLLNEAQETADWLTGGWAINTPQYERGIRLQLAIERAAK